MPDASAVAVAAVRTAAEASHQMQLKAAKRMLQMGPNPQQSQERHCSGKTVASERRERHGGVNNMHTFERQSMLKLLLPTTCK
jgi:hypothetical protein